MQTLFRRLRFQSLYFRQPPWDTGVSPPELFEFIASHPPGRAIDLGCGTGTNVITHAQAGWQVTGVDFAPRAVKLARQKARRAGVSVELHVRDVTRLDGIAGPFDLIFDLGCLHTIPQALRHNYLDQVDRILVPAGYWLLYGFLKSGTDHSGPGIQDAEVKRFSSRLKLVSRQDGVDDGRGRPSAWFLFQK